MLYVFISALFDTRWQRRSGIPRVEYELARQFAGRGAKLLTYNAVRRQFVEVDYERDILPITSAQDQCLDGVLDAPAAPIGMSPWLLAKLGAARIAPMLGPNAGTSLLARAHPALSPRERRQAAETLGILDKTDLALMYVSRATQVRQLQLPGALRMQPANLTAADTIFVPSIIWQAGTLEAFATLKVSSGVRIAAFIHDIIPVRRPQYFVDDFGVSQFRRYLDTILAASDCVCVNSRFIAADVAAYLREQELGAKPVFPVPLSAGITPETPATLTPRLAAMALPQGRYVLYVSTFNPRKNQAGIYHLWRRLSETMAGELPPLVFAGQRGWLSQDLLREIERDSQMKGRYIHFMDSPTDSELAHLYENCAFTVYPSHYEGWGLGITESLAFGKPCIAADNSALKEAGQGLAVHIDNFDGVRWLAEITRMIRDTPYRDGLAAGIRSRFKPRQWREVASELHDAISAAPANPTN